MTPAEKRLVEFVVWEMRYRDLPDDVRVAAESASIAHPRPAGFRKLTSGPLIVSSFPRDETLIEKRKVWPHQAGAIVTEFLRDDPTYVLVSAPSEPF